MREATLDEEVCWKAGRDERLNSSLIVTEKQRGGRKLPSCREEQGGSDGGGEIGAGSGVMSRIMTDGGATGRSQPDKATCIIPEEQHRTGHAWATICTGAMMIEWESQS